MLFDSHTHLNASEFDEDRDQALAKARAAGVKGMTLIGSDRESIDRANEMLAQNDDLLAVFGWHPVDAIDFGSEEEDLLRQQLTHPKAVGVGEIGLDFHWDKSPREVQERVLRQQLAIARDYELPVVIHSRDAQEATYQILKEEKIGEIGGVIHNFGDGPDLAQAYLDLGMYLSFSGVSTFKKSKEVREAVRLCPKDRILIETDSPYLTPEPKRGQKNGSHLVRYVCNRLADELDMSYEDFAQLTFDNACRFFNLTYDGQTFQKKGQADG
ncbi:TatD family hydrolase [Aerococcus sanguinicola]|uniref:TatD family hydrolase n=1 Tax=unclassified Aerococcus TaxID=2618060 RepID=UPI0008A4C85B|nr:MULTISPECIES: TatD family hydrolase [unclassified Aerococcus]MDK6234037.1 TatD family hydrolase [Aerococcus sp. UMB10185]MDK6855078.1 TatD family hydrolase [Aerococcus sp. UMB7533]OFN03559.1 hydrolase TatD [Aerococcus sp. HMSC062A02]OHO45774.1 hydrolase TatD [Aerococcus sp. HMSC035B07]